MKIDIEGAELMALQGALGVLKTARPIIMAELSRSVRECVALLEGNGYVLVTPTGERLRLDERATDSLCYVFAFPQERSEMQKSVFHRV
jgi:hypothetical protein